MRRESIIYDLEAAVGFSIMANRASGCRFGEKGFEPGWEVLERHRRWYELVFVVAPMVSVSWYSRKEARIGCLRICLLPLTEN